MWAQSAHAALMRSSSDASIPSTPSDPTSTGAPANGQPPPPSGMYVPIPFPMPSPIRGHPIFPTPHNPFSAGGHRPQTHMAIDPALQVGPPILTAPLPPVNDATVFWLRMASSEQLVQWGNTAYVKKCTQFDTLNDAYDKLLQKVNPHSAHHPHHANVANMTGLVFHPDFLPGQPATPSPLPIDPLWTNKQLDKLQYPNVRNWDRNDISESKNGKDAASAPGPDDEVDNNKDSKDKNAPCETLAYIVNEAGIPINNGAAAILRANARELFQTMYSKGHAPENWSVVGGEARRYFYSVILQAFPDLGLCQNDWKIEHFATILYPDFKKKKLRSLMDLIGTLKKEVKDELNSPLIQALENKQKKKRSPKNSPKAPSDISMNTATQNSDKSTPAAINSAFSDTQVPAVNEVNPQRSHDEVPTTASADLTLDDPLADISLEALNTAAPKKRGTRTKKINAAATALKAGAKKATVASKKVTAAAKKKATKEAEDAMLVDEVFVFDNTVFAAENWFGNAYMAMNPTQKPTIQHISDQFNQLSAADRKVWEGVVEEKRLQSLADPTGVAPGGASEPRTKKGGKAGGAKGNGISDEIPVKRRAGRPRKG